MNVYHTDAMFFDRLVETQSLFILVRSDVSHRNQRFRADSRVRQWCLVATGIWSIFLHIEQSKTKRCLYFEGVFKETF